VSEASVPSGRIVIIGAGIAGLTLALALARRSIPTLVFERSEKLKTAGAGLQLSPNATTCLMKLGLKPALLQSGHRPGSIVMQAAEKGAVKPLAKLAIQDFAQQRGLPPYLTLYRADLQKLLLEALYETGLMTLQMGAGFQGVLYGEDKLSVAVAGPKGQGAVDCDLLIGADGVKSAVRSEVRAQPQAIPTGQLAWRALIDGPSPQGQRPMPLSPHEPVYLTMGSRFHHVRYPLRQGQMVNHVLIVPENSAAGRDSLNTQELASLYPDVPPALLQDVPLETIWTPWPLLTVSPDQDFVRGRVVLIGDSAHAMLPFMAQGACMAIEDACVLARLIDENRDSLDTVPMLYTHLRHHRVRKVWRASQRNSQLYHLPGPLAGLRNFALRKIPEEWLLQPWVWLYNWQDRAGQIAP
jgi:salicylate hydroxylase